MKGAMPVSLATGTSPVPARHAPARLQPRSRHRLAQPEQGVGDTSWITGLIELEPSLEGFLTLYITP